MRSHALHTLLAQSGNPFFHEDTPNQVLLDNGFPNVHRPRHSKHHHAVSLTGQPMGGPQGAAPPPPAAPAAGTPEDKKEGDAEGAEKLEYQLENGKTIFLSGESDDACKSSCQKELAGLDDAGKEGTTGASMMNLASGGEQQMMAGCVRFCQTEFEIQCFPASSTVVVRDRGRIPLSSLRVGDHVLVMRRSGPWLSGGKSSGWSMHFEPVITWLHHEPDAKMEIVQVRHSLGEVNISLDHMIFAKKAESSCFEAIHARDVAVGDRVLAPWIDGSLVEPQVLSVTRQIAEGAYAPLMPSGALLVDGTAVSCYTAPNDLKSLPPYAALLGALKCLTGRESAHDVAHMLMFPLRIFHQTAAQWRVQFGDSQPGRIVDGASLKARSMDIYAPLATHNDKSIEDHVHPYGLALYVVCKALFI